MDFWVGVAATSIIAWVLYLTRERRARYVRIYMQVLEDNSWRRLSPFTVKGGDSVTLLDNDGTREVIKIRIKEV